MSTLDDLRRLPPEERAELLRELIRLADDDPLAMPGFRLRRRFALALLVACCVWLVPWTVMLAYTLPAHYEAGQWRLAWIGFDIALTLAIGATALAGFRRLQVVVFGQIVCGTLLICDAWFDTMLSWGTRDFPLSLATALLGELPLAGLLFFAARRVVMETVHSMWKREGRIGPEPRFRQIRIFTIENRRSRRD
ncbi:hypothetical protein [Actinomadura rupiterrae]|uniref:hypothetical protein n=1 Tax=Actinomadura rupiterrae TaxID=559627 RepID=UPI0020A5CBFE|nr:hypothetical protein [Actinomadura rupiterrae]MCP2334716.1 hypothetical protein [Actinomadura rupiterrae]